jgi:hypothetical protein
LVIADVHADIRVPGLEHRVAQVAGLEVELLPEPGAAVRNVVLSIFAEVRAVGVDHRGGVVVHARGLLFVQRNHDHHLMGLGQRLHQLRGRPIRNALRGVIPPRRLLGAEIRACEDFLHAEDLHTGGARAFDQLDVLRRIRLADDLERFICAAGVRGLDQSDFDVAWHWILGQGKRSGNVSETPRLRPQCGAS